MRLIRARGDWMVVSYDRLGYSHERTIRVAQPTVCQLVDTDRGHVCPVDATGLSLPSDSFDLVHERTVLLNVADPQKVVAEMVRVARRGGVVAVQEPDSASWLCDPPHPAFGTLHQELLAAYRAAGKNFDQGRTIARRLTDAGLTAVRVRATARVTRPGEYYHTFLLALTGLVREQIIAAGRISAAEFDRLSAELREHLQQPGTLTGQPNMWQAWGTKP